MITTTVVLSILLGILGIGTGLGYFRFLMITDREGIINGTRNLREAFKENQSTFNRSYLLVSLGILALTVGLIFWLKMVGILK